MESGIMRLGKYSKRLKSLRTILTYSRRVEKPPDADGDQLKNEAGKKTA